MSGEELARISARRFYVLLRGLPADSLFVHYVQNTPREVTSREEIEAITARALQ